MFHIKICGIRSIYDVEAVAASCADAIGLNFFPKSVRYVDPMAPTTAELSRHAAESQLARVGVFVNDSADTILEVSSTVGLDQVQLHGDESVELAETLVQRGLNVIRAIKLPAHSLGSQRIADSATLWLEAGCSLLLDAESGAAHGGSGQKLDWDSIHDWAQRFPQVEWALAGGLKVGNIAQAIAQSGATSVDVASGVEQPRGTKSRGMIDQFAAAAAESFAHANRGM